LQLRVIAICSASAARWALREDMVNFGLRAKRRGGGAAHRRACGIESAAFHAHRRVRSLEQMFLEATGGETVD
jgi:hypothetical protein